ncbi:MAG: ABC transporter permease [Clostridium sp.]
MLKVVKRYGKFVTKNLLRLMLLLLAVSAVSFFLISISPIDPLTSNVGQAALGSMTGEQVVKLEQYWGVGIPAGERFLNWFLGILHGDFGISLLYRRPVQDVIGEKLLNSLWRMTFAWLFSGILGAALGILAGVKRGKWQDKAVTAYCMVIAGTPAFWLALVLMVVFAVQLHLFPIGFSIPIGMAAADVTLGDRIAHAVLPALALGLTGVSGIAMHTRAKMIEVMESDYVFYARARGESMGSIVRRHGIRNILLPVITLQFASVSEILGGSILVEQVFSYPGLGQAAVTAGLGSDVPLLLGITLISAAIVFLGNFMADLLYQVVDPRMKRRQFL